MRYLLLLLLVSCGGEGTPPERKDDLLRDHLTPPEEHAYASTSSPEGSLGWEGYDCSVAPPVKKCTGSGTVVNCEWNQTIFIRREGIEHIDSEYICDPYPRGIPENEIRTCVHEWKEICRKTGESREEEIQEFGR